MSSATTGYASAESMSGRQLKENMTYAHDEAVVEISILDENDNEMFRTARIVACAVRRADKFVIIAKMEKTNV